MTERDEQWRKDITATITDFRDAMEVRFNELREMHVRCNVSTKQRLEQGDQDLRMVKELLTGNGRPETGLAVRLVALEKAVVQSAESRLRHYYMALAACLTAAGALLVSCVKHWTKLP